uniref:Enamelin n=1 Tax=Geotrypetes seraphini TaxID=260995 RepID=A0A6P8QGI9_GEOSA|nr:enamelin [Geotrypetes seraphini]
MQLAKQNSQGKLWVPQLSSIYGYSPQYATLFHQQQQRSILPQQQIQLWKLPIDIQPKLQLKQTQMSQQPKRPSPAMQPTQHQLQPLKPIQQPTLKQPTYHQPVIQPQKQPPASTATQKPQTFSPFGNILNPYQQLWQIPQIYNPGRGYLLNPFHGTQYFGYYGFGARPPYNSEEDAMENEDAGEPAKKEPKAESPAPDAATNSTTSSTNSTTASPPEANQGTNATNSQNSPANNGASAPKPNQGGNPSTSTPTVNAPNHRDHGGSTINSNGPNLLNNRGSPPQGDPRPRFPQVKQTTGGGPLGPRENLPGYGVHPQQGNTRNNPLVIPESKPSVRTGNPLYTNINPQGYKGNVPVNAVNRSNHRGNSQIPSNNNYPEQTRGISQNPRNSPSGNYDNFHHLGINPSVQRGMREFSNINPIGQRISPPYREDIPDYRTILHREGRYPAPDFKSLQQNENSLYPREDTYTFPSQQFPKGIFLDQNIKPSYPDNDPADQLRNVQNNWGQEESSPHPGTGPSIPHENVPYSEVEPSVQQEIMPSARNDIWNNRDSIPVFEAAQSKQQYTSPYRERYLYPENDPYDDRGNSFQPRSSTWMNRENFYRDYIGQRGRPSDSNFYLENDPVDQRSHMPYADRNTWDYGTSFPAYEANQKSPDHQGTIFYPEGYVLSPGENPLYDRSIAWNQERHPPDLNPTRLRGNTPYLSHDPPVLYPPNQPFDRRDTWRREEHFPTYSIGPPRQTDYIPYRSNAPYGHRDSIPYSSGNAWDIESNSPVHNRLLPPSERNSWDYHNQDIAPSTQLENSLYFRSHPAGMRGNPVHHEARDWSYGREQTIDPESNPAVYRGITAYPSVTKLCCKDSLPPPSPRENVLALKDNSRREKRGSSPQYPDSKHASYPQESQTTPQNNSLNSERNISGPRESLLLKQRNNTFNLTYPEVDSDLSITTPSWRHNNEGKEPNITQATETNPLRKQPKVMGSKRQRVNQSTKRKNREKRSLPTGMKSKTVDSDVDWKQRLPNRVR